MRPLIAEALGTFWLVLVVVAAQASGQVPAGIAAGGVAGLAYLSAALAFGPVSAGHFNPVLTFGLRRAGGFMGSLTLTLLAQIAGALAALIVAPRPLAMAGGGIAEGGAHVSFSLALGAMTALAVLHVMVMRTRPDLASLATAAALAAAVAVIPGGHAALNAAHATAAWLWGAEVPLMLILHWLGVVLAGLGAGALWALLAAPGGERDADQGGDAPTDAGTSNVYDPERGQGIGAPSEPLLQALRPEGEGPAKPVTRLPRRPARPQRR